MKIVGPLFAEAQYIVKSFEYYIFDSIDND